MKLTTKAFNDDYCQRDIGIGFRGRNNHKRSNDLLLKRRIKRRLNKIRRQDNKKACDVH